MLMSTGLNLDYVNVLGNSVLLFYITVVWLLKSDYTAGLALHTDECWTKLRLR